MDDSIQLAIRDEVEKRVEQREALYWKFGGLFAVVVVLFFGVLWRVSISEIRETVEKQLAEKEVVKARDRIMAINSAAEDVNRNLTSISSSMNTNQEQFMERLNQIKQQDNVVFADDLSKLFVVQRVTNLVEGRKIFLNFEAIPQTIHVTIKTPNSTVALPMWSPVGFSLEGNNLIITNEPVLNTIYNIITNTPSFQAQYQLNVDYVRKSIH